MQRQELLNKIGNVKVEHVLLALILLAGIFFRFYNIPARYGFDNDPTRDILLVQYAATNLKIPLVGAISGIGAFNFGPWYYYQLILTKLLFPFSYSPWIYIGIASVLSIFLMYKIGESLENKRFGLLLAFFFALSPSETGQTQALSNPSLIPIFAVLTVYIFVRFFERKMPSWWLLVWGFIMGVGINIHYQFVCLLPLPILLFIQNRENLLKRISMFIIGFFVPFIPLLTFNLYTHGNTIYSAKYYFSTGRTGTYIPNSWKIYVFDFWLKYISYIFGSPYLLGVAVAFYTTAWLAYLKFKNRLKPVYFALILTLFLDFIFLRYFLPQRDYYYYLFIHPVIFILVGLAFWQITKLKKGMLILVCILAILGLLMINGTLPSLKSRQDFLSVRAQAKKLIALDPNRKILFYSCSDHGKYMAQGLTFFLGSSENLSGKDLKKVGVADFQCNVNYLDNSLTDGYLGEKQDLGERLVNLDSLSDQELRSLGWVLISPETIYHNTVDWWETPQRVSN